MDFQRGERVNLNFDTGAVQKLETEDDLESSLPAFPSFVGDILEHDSSPANPPVAPSFKPNVNGFPAPKKRTPRVSAFKQQRAAKEAASTAKTQDAPPPRAAASSVEQEMQSIDRENQERLAAMSEAEIEQERQELMQSLNPALLQKLLARSNIEQGSNEKDFNLPGVEEPAKTRESETKPATSKKVSFAPEEFTAPATIQSPPVVPSPSTSEPHLSSTTPSDIVPTDPSESIHFPTTPQPTLNPSDPNFLKNLHTKYFPDLSHDPSKLSWMTPIDPNDTTSPYHPSHNAMNASDLRFDFNGSLLAPSVARAIPTDRGLHHHADAPEAAGYTIPELSILARSAVASQRCMAYQTLGRILYRLGQGEFGVEKSRRDGDRPVRVMSNPNTVGDSDDEDDEDEDVGSAMAAGLWTCIEKGQVIETLTEEANKSKGHLSARTLAQEALWNWRRGGGRKRAAV